MSAEMLFEYEEISPGRWRCRNSMTGVVHVTYGMREEVERSLLRQTRIWMSRAKRQDGRGWKKGWDWTGKPTGGEQ